MSRKTKAPPTIPRTAFSVDVWEERDRLMIRAIAARTRYNLQTGEMDILGFAEPREVACWWDDDARSMFKDGFFDRRDLEGSVFEYCRSVGLIA